MADSVFHNLAVLGKNEKACWSITEWGGGITCELYDIALRLLLINGSQSSPAIRVGKLTLDVWR